MSEVFNKELIDEAKRLLSQIKADNEGQEPSEYISTRRDFAECLLSCQILMAEENLKLYDEHYRVRLWLMLYKRALLELAEKLVWTATFCPTEISPFHASKCDSIDGCSDLKQKACWVKYALEVGSEASIEAIQNRPASPGAGAEPQA